MNKVTADFILNKIRQAFEKAYMDSEVEALQMAIDALRSVQNDEPLAEAYEKKNKEDHSNKTTQELTISDLTIMAEYANKNKIEIELTVTPDKQQMRVRPWDPE